MQTKTGRVLLGFMKNVSEATSIVLEGTGTLSECVMYKNECVMWHLHGSREKRNVHNSVAVFSMLTSIVTCIKKDIFIHFSVDL